MIGFTQAVAKGRADIEAGQGVPWPQAKAALDRMLTGYQVQEHQPSAIWHTYQIAS